MTEDVEKEFFKALSMVKSKDSKIYNKDECKFFDNIKTSNGNEEADSKKSSKEKEKKYHSGAKFVKIDPVVAFLGCPLTSL